MRLLSRPRAFSLIEVLASIGLSAVFFTTAALVYQNITANAKSLDSLETLELGEATLANLFGIDSDTINVYSAPNHGRAAFASHLAETFRDDVAAASAVYLLGRDGLNELRPSVIPYPAGSPLLDGPEAFLAHLADQFGADDTASFVDYRGSSSAEDLTVYLIQPNGDPEELSVLAIYEMDFIPVSGLGTYVAVRRFVEGLLTAYYDVLYPESAGMAFSPVAAHFSRRARAGHETDPDVAKYAVAEEQPFYLMWWPDPSSRTLERVAGAVEPSVEEGSAVWDYFHLGGRTRFFFAVPAFPSQQ
jgi:hypothetical protein